jgi:hypothetical protein
MALMINISSYVSGGYTNPIRWKLFETGTGVLVDQHDEAGPHGVEYNFTFEDNIRDIVYTIKMYEVISGTENLIKSHDVTATTSTISDESDIELIVGGAETYDPADGASTVTVPATIGKDCYLVQRGFGQLRENRSVECTHDPVTGEFSLSGGITFTLDDTYFVKIRTKYIINPPGTDTVTSIYKDIVLITEDYTVTALDFGKLFIVDGTDPVVTLQFPAIADMPEKVQLRVESIGTNSINVVNKAATGETISAIGTTSNTLILGKGESANFIKLGSTLYGFSDSPDIKRAGQHEWGYYLGLNRLWADGTEYNTADYPRLKKAMDEMESGTVVDYTTWAQTTVILGVTYYKNRAKFALSGDGTMFKVPDLKNLFIRALNGTGSDSQRITQGPGGMQRQDLMPHKHGTNIANTNNGTGFTFGGGGVPGRIGTTTDFDGAETRPTNAGLIPMIIC